ncbi:hypothetical protein QE152_g24857 [Popillia japonica]|uniref:Uncharacterized protein n=1 Tax=Popillia japonica TaxID=7064 RepID=A0AAW1K341_POPJA
MLIKPKNPQDSEKTKTDIKNQLSPANLEVGIKEIRTVKDGGILIKCANKTEVDKLKKEVKCANKTEVDKLKKEAQNKLQCANKTEVDKLKKEAQNKLQKNYVIKT